ncbi:hypothetical protein FPJ27_15495 [Burkholderia sp. MS455]|uniref:hypothetical protein n=1 Tax=Burkholderia sp. MS455 TaxID=2811788 RepID=UPI0019569D2B|nr:hypothetical protein [Burkholderia sp. MS455]QRR07666.1 hypothetical protein FPJ27_15495 [Burkholderia sp. MS455]
MQVTTGQVRYHQGTGEHVPKPAEGLDNDLTNDTFFAQLISKSATGTAQISRDEDDILDEILELHEQYSRDHGNIQKPSNPFSNIPDFVDAIPQEDAILDSIVEMDMPNYQDRVVSSAIEETAPNGVQLAPLPRGFSPDNYHWNERGLLERKRFEAMVYRADRRSPDEILEYGFAPSRDFAAIKKMIDNDALIVAGSLEAVRRYIRGRSGYYVYEINALDSPGASLNENYLFNRRGLIAHLGNPSLYSKDPAELTMGANTLMEVHIPIEYVNKRRGTIVRHLTI